MTSETPLRTGVLFKKGSGTGPFGRRNWKPRYFVLTPRKLSYYTYEDGELKGEVDLTGCTDQSIEVMPADSMKTGSSASTIWRIAINASDRRFIVAAGTEMEMNGWVEQLLVAFHVNSGQPLPQRRSTMIAPPTSLAPGAAPHSATDMDMARNSITDFQNFATARRSVGGAHAHRASMGVQSGGLEFRLSDEQKQLDHQRQLAETEAERLREEELLQAHLRRQAEERHQEKERLEAEEREQHESAQEAERLRLESLLEEQRRLKREQHERERGEAERQMRELELQEQEEKNELEIQHHLAEEEKEVQEVEIHRRPVVPQPPPPPPPPASPVHSPVVTPPSAPSPPPRSSLIGDAKKDAMMRQQTKHNKRREASIKEQQEQTRKDFATQQQQQSPMYASENGAGNAVTGASPSSHYASTTSVEF